jgi:pimeloyl-ACP methyl ester carboxylesterase
MRRVLPPLAVLCLCFSQSTAAVSLLTATGRNGQVFLTWTNVSDNSAYYKIYRSPAAISYGYELANCEYLGLTNARSAIDNNLTYHDGTDRYLHIEDGSPALTPGTGLFVATTLADGEYHYAVTILAGGTEDTTIIRGLNSTLNPVAEAVAKPLPVLQEIRTINGKAVEIYTLFVSSKTEVNQTPWLSAGFLPFDFAVYRNGSTINQPLKIYLHPGGSTFLDDITTVTSNGEVNLFPEDYYPDELVDPAWWGSNENFNVFNDSLNATPPSSGINHNYTQLRLNAIIDWAIHHLPIDSNRIYLRSNSQGSPGAFLYTLNYPERIAAAHFANGNFNLAFENDWQANCSFNAGKKNRKKVDQRLGSLSTNLSTSLGLSTSEALNGGWMIHHFDQRDLPVIYSINGKNDILMGWTEKTIYYDSVNNNHCGGYYFWDSRDHGGNTGITWSDGNFDLFRYKRNASYPAFANCSLNEDFGDGNGNSGAGYGTINGTLDWDASLTDDSLRWEAKLFVKNLLNHLNQTILYPDSATADVTLRRLQQFHPAPGSLITWTVAHHQEIVQSGTIEYEGGLITIPAVKIFRDTSLITLLIAVPNTYYADADGDGAGNPDSLVHAAYQLPGVVENNTDCDDGNPAVNPAAAESCNSIDDNCNGMIDEDAGTLFYADEDHDGFGDPGQMEMACSAPSGYVTDSSDCNDENDLMHPGAGELCNSLDDDCSGSIDDGLMITFYADEDHDGFGDANRTIVACSASEEYVADSSDCDDTNDAVHPGHDEVCNGLDDNCNAQIDEGLASVYFRDSDLDGFGDAGSTISACTVPEGYVTNSTDCNDLNAQVNPSSAETCNAIDDNCNAVIDDSVIAVSISPYGSVSVCKKVRVTLTAEVTGTALTYQWKKNGNNISGATGSTYLTGENDAGTYTVAVAAEGGCSSVSGGTTITRLASPSVSITAGGLDLCGVGNILLKATNNSSYTYQWQLNGSNIAGATTSKYKATQSGSYAVTATNSAGCSTTSTAVLLYSSCKESEDDRAAEIDFVIAPNPNNGDFTIRFSSPVTEGGLISVYDVAGRTCHSTTTGADASALPVLLRDLQPGIYFLEWRTPDALRTKKFLVSGN